MELDGPTLQLIFNVVMITAVTSLATFCCLLRRANKQLTSELNQPRVFKSTFAEYGVDPGPRVDTAKEPSPNVPLPVAQDIREFVTHRSQAWRVASTGTPTKES